MIIIVCGLPGVGKTTLSEQLAPLVKAIVLSSDKIRKELFPRPTYSRHERRLVYEVMMILAKYLTDSGINCILDATFNREDSRLQIKRNLDLDDNQFQIVECVCSEDVIISRLKTRRNDYSDANVSTYRKMRKIYEPVKFDHITVDTRIPAEINALHIFNEISKKRTTP